MKNWKQWHIFFSWTPKSLVDCSCSLEIKRCLFLGRKYMTNLDSILKSRDLTLPTNLHTGKAMFFFSSHVWMWDLDHKEDWIPKNWCFWTVVLEKTLESPLGSKENKPVNPKGNQPWIFIGRTDAKAEAETSILWPPDGKSQLIRKVPDALKDWEQQKKGVTEDEMVGWHHWFSGHELEETQGDSEGQGSLVCCSPQCHKELDMT